MTKRPPLDRTTLSHRLREAIADRGLSAYAIARDAGVDPGVVSRFLTGVRDIRLATADRISAALGLRLVDVGRGKSRQRPQEARQGVPAPLSTETAGPAPEGQDGPPGD